MKPEARSQKSEVRVFKTFTKKSSSHPPAGGLAPNSQNGFTLVEVVISMAILSMTFMIAALSFTTIVRLQQKGTTIRNIQQNSRYAVELISRDVRNASTYQIGQAGRELLLPNSLDLDSKIRYTWEGNSIYRELCSPDCGAAPTDGENVTGDNVRVTNFVLEQLPAPYTASRPMRVNLQTAQVDATLTETDPYFYQYQINTIVTPRR